MQIKINKGAFHSLQKIFNIQMLYAISFFLCLIFLFSASIFVYKFILDTMAYTGEAMRLKKIVSPESFDRKEFDSIIKNIQEKTKISSRHSNKKVKNIFLGNAEAENFETLAKQKNTATTTEEIPQINY